MFTPPPRVALAGLFLVATACAAAHAGAQNPAAGRRPDRAAIVASIDSIARAGLEGGRMAGLSLAVVWGRDTLLMKGYGFADLELDVATPDRAVYAIASLTKQFTATAIMQLVEQGKISLDDEITKYFPGYPTQGHRVTVRRLLDHTSGIRGYTEIPAFRTIEALRLPRDTLVALFSKEPFDFAPGEAAVYNNSAYFLLGLIIEKVAGVPYADYVKRNLFDRAGMADSHYCGNVPVVKGRTHGYQFTPRGLERAPHVDHTWPYAAGSLCSTVGDLIAWNQALHGGRLVSPAAYRELITPGTLNDGTRLRYAKGLAVGSAPARRSLYHGGEISGYLSAAKYLPDDSLQVVVLANTQGPVSLGAMVDAITERVLGKATIAAVPFNGDLAQFTGKFKGVGRGHPMELEFVVTNGALAAQRAAPLAPAPMVLHYVGNDTFESANGNRFTFVREGGRVTKVRVDRTFEYSILARQ